MQMQFLIAVPELRQQMLELKSQPLWPALDFFGPDFFEPDFFGLDSWLVSLGAFRFSMY